MLAGGGRKSALHPRPLSSTTTTPQVNRHVASGLSTPPSPPLPGLGAHLGHDGQRHGQPLGGHRDHPGLHRLGHVPVAGADHGALTLATATGLVAHQLVDRPGSLAAGPGGAVFAVLGLVDGRCLLEQFGDLGLEVVRRAVAGHDPEGDVLVAAALDLEGGADSVQ